MGEKNNNNTVSIPKKPMVKQGWRMQKHLQVWKDGQGAKVNLCEEIRPRLVLNRIMEFTDKMNEKGRGLVQEEGGSLSKGPEAWKNAE